MRALRVWANRLAGLFGKERREQELSAEIESHLAMHISDNLRAGMSPDEARRQARLQLGGVESLKEVYRERSTAPIVEHLLLDVRFTIRQLWKRPGFALTAVLVLALGMGATIANFAFVDVALIKPLPYKEPLKLLSVTESTPQFPRGNLSYLDYLDWKRMNDVFQSLDIFNQTGFLLEQSSGAEPTRGARVSAGFFETLGVAPEVGRFFSHGEELAGGPRAVVLSYQTWQKRFGANRDIAGHLLNLSGVGYTVIGVLPANFRFAPVGTAEFWVPVRPSDSGCEQRRSCHNLYGVARLKEGVSIHSAAANMTAIARQLERQYPDSNRGQGASVIQLSEAIAGSFRPILLVLMGGAVLLLIISLVNVASLLLVRSEGRRREVGVRRAMGASNGRLVTQFLMESLLLVAAATGFGLLFGHWAMQGMKKLVPADMIAGMPFLSDLGFSWRVLICAASLSIASALLLATTPVFHLLFSKMQADLSEGSRGSAGQAWRRLGSRLVMVELATAMVLLVGAGLFGKSLYLLLRVELGFQPDHLATLAVAAPDPRYGKNGQNVALAREIVQTIHSIPGIQSAALTTILPVGFNGNTDWIRFVGKPYDGKHIEVNERDVSAEYFRTIGATLVRGRYFNDGEDDSKRKVVIINQALATKYFAGEDPIGRQIGDISLSPKSLKTIIGVVEDIRDGALDSEIWPAEYHPFNQDPDTYFEVIARTEQKPDAVLAGMARAIHQLHSDLGVRDEMTMEAHINGSLTAYLHRSSAWLVGSFAALALVLGVVGLYAVVAYSVSQRTREIGVRMALGAQQRSVYRLILKEAGAVTAVGIVVGAAGAVGAATVARKLLFGVSSWDAPTLIEVGAVLLISTLGASFFPARRAASVDPVQALRTE